jgi:hypothetical protein
MRVGWKLVYLWKRNLDGSTSISSADSGRVAVTDHIDKIGIEVGEPRSIFTSESDLINPTIQLLSRSGSVGAAYLALPSPAKSRPTG